MNDEINDQEYSAQSLQKKVLNIPSADNMKSSTVKTKRRRSERLSNNMNVESQLPELELVLGERYIPHEYKAGAISSTKKGNREHV